MSIIDGEIWADERLKRAYQLIDEALGEQDHKTSVHAYLTTARSAIEDADVELDSDSEPVSRDSGSHAKRENAEGG